MEILFEKCLCQAAIKNKKVVPSRPILSDSKSAWFTKATIALAHQLLKIAYILLKEQITYPEFLAQKKTTRDELVA